MRAPFGHAFRMRLWFGLRAPRLLSGLTDRSYLRLAYGVLVLKRLDLREPRTFTQKLQWLKLHDRRPEYTRLVDKYAVKEWVAERIGETFVIPALGVWDSVDEIDVNRLPEQFVLKATHDSGSVVVCADRSSFDMGRARAVLERSLARNYYRSMREWPYRDVPPRVLAEPYLPTWAAAPGAAAAGDEASVVDYRFFCFHGEPRFLIVSKDANESSVLRRDVLTLDWEPTGFAWEGYVPSQELPPRPAEFDEMIEIARTLASGIPFVRVDLFHHAGRVLFSEMTFSPGSGMRPLQSASADAELGALLDLSRVEVAA